jgi:hypothetical protein
MKIKLQLFVAILFISICLISVKAQTFPLDASQWTIDPQQIDQMQPFNKNGAVAFWFPNYTVNPDWFTGNLYLPWTQPLTGTSFVATIQIDTFPVDPIKAVRFVPAYNGDCISPAQAHIYFQTGSLYNDLDGTRWWSNPVAWELQNGSVTLTVSLDPSQWSSTYGHFGTELPAQFQNAIAHPTYVGITFGGNCAFGHGVQTKKGDARFKLYYFACQ